MGSPFPGMDPYLEHPAWWPDFHLDFIGSLRAHLNARLPTHYSARAQESVRLVEVPPEGQTRVLFPDVSVTGERHVPGSGSESAAAPAGVATLEPVTLPLPLVEEVREHWIEITRQPDRELVGVVEVLFPWNKTGRGHGEYLAKRADLLRQAIHLIELDLLLGGERLPMGRPLPAGDYYALVSHAERRPNSQVYAWRLRDPLPKVTVPLRAPDADVSLDLGDVFRVTYERGAYERDVYRMPPVPAVRAEDRPWVLEVPAANLRRS